MKVDITVPQSTSYKAPPNKSHPGQISPLKRDHPSNKAPPYKSHPVQISDALRYCNITTLSPSRETTPFKRPLFHGRSGGGYCTQVSNLCSVQLMPVSIFMYFHLLPIGKIEVSYSLQYVNPHLCAYTIPIQL